MDYLRLVLDDLTMLILMGGAFLWLIRRKPTTAVVTAFFLLTVFDVGSYYHKTVTKETMVNQNKSLDRSSPFPFNRDKYLLEKEDLETAYTWITVKIPAIDISSKNSNLIEIRDFDGYITKNIDFLRENHEAEALLWKARVVGEDQWERFVSGRPASLLEDLESDSSQLSVSKYSPNELRMLTLITEPGYVYFQDNYDAGWKGYVDGAEAPVINTRPFKAIRVGQGYHTVAFSYRPAWRWILHAVLHLFVFGTGGSLLYLYWQWIRSRRQDAAQPTQAQ